MEVCATDPFCFCFVLVCFRSQVIEVVILQNLAPVISIPSCLVLPCYPALAFSFFFGYHANIGHDAMRYY